MSVSRSQDPNLSQKDRLRILYPMVHEEETPLPQFWSSFDKHHFITLAEQGRCALYDDPGIWENGTQYFEPSSVRANYPIPESCGMYYFEVRIISKGRKGNIGVGLSTRDVDLFRLPGWVKHSYAYHGDDGNKFGNRAEGQAYGPTFTTNDVIGCGLNLKDRSCLFTKNGTDLGVAFTDLPSNLYPTVGLFSPGEVVSGNFGQDIFVFDVEKKMHDLQNLK